MSTATKKEEATNRPATEFKSGFVRATVWPNETTKGTRYNVTLSRLYNSGDGWKSTSSFGARDLPDVLRATVLAEIWVRDNTPQDAPAAEEGR